MKWPGERLVMRTMLHVEPTREGSTGSRLGLSVNSPPDGAVRPRFPPLQHESRSHIKKRLQTASPFHRRLNSRLRYAEL